MIACLFIGILRLKLPFELLSSTKQKVKYAVNTAQVDDKTVVFLVK